MPKVVYHSSYRDKHNRLRCDSNMGPLTIVRCANYSATETCRFSIRKSIDTGHDLLKLLENPVGVGF